MISFFEVFAVSAGLLAMSAIIWMLATTYFSLPYKNVSATDMFRNAGYKYFDLPRIVLVILTAIVFLKSVSIHRSGEESANTLVASIIIYSAYLLVCGLVSRRTAKAYIARMNGWDKSRAAR
jgi:hypothetical protein